MTNPIHHPAFDIDAGHLSALARADGAAHIVSHPHLDRIELRFACGDGICLTPQGWRHVIDAVTTVLDNHWADEKLVTA